MKKQMQNALIACATALPMMVPPSAIAQTVDETSCTCITTHTGAVAGKLLRADGEVLVSQPAGFAGAASGSALAVGSRIVVGPNSSAVIDVGASCRLSLPENTDVSVLPMPGNNLCVVASNPAAGRGGASSGAAALIIGGLVAGAAVAVGIGGGDDDDGAPVSDQ